MVLHDRILHLISKSGTKHTVLYLKECSVAIMHHVAGKRDYSSQFPVYLTRGIPRLLPSSLRSLVRSRDRIGVKVILTILQVYRVLYVPTTLKLNTITDPLKHGSQSILNQSQIRIAFREFNFSEVAIPKMQFQFSRSAGPNHNPSMFGI